MTYRQMLTHKFFLALILIFGVHFFYSLFAQTQNSLQPNVSLTPGRYNTAHLLSVFAQENTRLSLSLEGQPILLSQFPLLLDCNAGEERTFNLEIVSTSIIPTQQNVETYRYAWTIDKKAPSVPTYSIRPQDKGEMITFFLNETGRIHFQLYQSTFDAYAQGFIAPGSEFFLPENTVLCVVGVDEAGNKSPAFSRDSSITSQSVLHSAVTDSTNLPFIVINPIPGNWSNKQVLVIEHERDVMVFFSVDGSDPTLTGLIYDEPVLLDMIGTVTIRIHAIHRNGTKWSSQLRYSVSEMESAPPMSVPISSGMIPVGEFSEILIPEGYTYSVGSSVSGSLETPVTPGGKPLAISGIRGVSRFYPLTLTDGNLLWRWICSVGFKEPINPPIQVETPIRLYDWHFITVELDSEVYYSLDDSIWAPLTRPVFLDRKKSHVFQWYSPSVSSGKVHLLNLPPKPVLRGMPPSFSTSSSVFLSIDNPLYTYTYDAGSFYIPERPTFQQSSLSSGIVVEVPLGATVPFSFRFSAYLEGIYQGDLASAFIIDRSPPAKPVLQLTPDTNYSNTPVILSPQGEEQLFLSIQPSSYTKKGTSYILEGDENTPVVYTISATAKDIAGNSSEVTTKRVTVDRNALYIDAQSYDLEKANGTPAFPFATLDEALLRIRDTKKWRIFVRGPTTFSSSHTIQSNISISGENAVITFAHNARLLVVNGALQISGCTIISDAKSGTADTPLFSFQNAVFDLTDSVVSVQGSDTQNLLSATSSVITVLRSKLSLASTSYALMFTTQSSQVSVTDSSTKITSRNASVYSLIEGSLKLTRVKSDVVASRAARVIESWGATLSLDTVSISRKDISGNSVANKDTAVWYTGSSSLITNKNLNVIGFSQTLTQGSR